MFDLLSIQIHNFKSYTDTHRFEFPKEPGLYFITGENKTNERLGANASGKTSFIDAINWCLYGRTTRSLKAGDVINWNAKSCDVTLEVRVGNKTYSIKRSQSPNSLSLNDDVVEQQDVDKALRLNQESFLHSVIIPQFGMSFFDLQPTQKLTLFSDIMNLDYWITQSQKAKSDLSDVNSIKDDLENKISNLDGEIKTRKSGLKTIRTNLESFDDNKKAEIKNLENEKALKIKSTVIPDIELLELRFESLNNKLKLLKKTEKSLKKQKVDLNLIDKEQITKISKLDSNISYIKNDLNKLLTIGAVCKVCKQKVDQNHLKKHKSEFDNSIKNLELQVKVVVEDNSQTNKEINSLSKKIIEIENKILDKSSSVSETEKKIYNAKLKQKQLSKQITELDDRIDKEKNKVNPFNKILEDEKKLLSKAKTEIIKVQEQLDEYVFIESSLSYWVGGFKSIRLFIIEEAIKNLEIEINNSLTMLGLVDWQIRLDVERENKSGGITKGFSVLIEPPDHDKQVRFESWSGGETQRLRLAGDLGLSNLIMERAGLNNEIEFYDEPSEHMSKEGLDDLVETLSDRAIETGRKIYLVDHNTIESDLFVGVLSVIKDSKGSHLKFEGVDSVKFEMDNSKD